jgi:uncharacterized protein YdaU (DUF1376 family)
MAWFAFDVDAYDADTMHLSAAEDGVYCRLLRFYYKTRLSLPDDDRALAAIARVSSDEWSGMKDTIRAFFKTRRGRLHHKRCDRELDREDELSRRRSERATNAAHKRHGKSKTSMLRADTQHARSTDTVMLGDATRPDQTREKKEDPPTPQRGEGEGGGPFEAWWSAYPEKVGKGAARRAYAKARKKADAETLLAGVARYRASKPADRAWCNPATWLNQERWLDRLGLALVTGTDDLGLPATSIADAGKATDDLYRRLGVS